MQISEDFKDKNPNVISYLTKGFWKNFFTHSAWIFTVLLATLAAMQKLSSLKLVFLCLILSIIISIFFTLYSNIKKLLAELSEVKYKLESNQLEYSSKINTLQNELDKTKLNRDTILENFEKHKHNAIMFMGAYHSAKHAMLTLANMQNDENTKVVIENLFKTIEKEQIERVETNE